MSFFLRYPSRTSAIGAVLCFYLVSSSAGAACSGKFQTPWPYPVTVHPPSVLQGVAIKKIGAFIWRGGKWKAVAVQVDEVNNRGDFVLENGLPYTAGTDDGFLDDNDDISVRGPDLGEDFAAHEKLPAGVLPEKAVKLQVCDGEELRGSVLLAATAAGSAYFAPPVSFDSRTHFIRSAAYTYKFHETHPMLLGDIIMETPAGPQQVFAAARFAMPILPKWWFRFTFDDTDFTSEVECWRAGPVRTIVAVGAKLRKFFSLLRLHMFSELVFYENYFRIPTKIEFMLDANQFLRLGSGLAYLLSFPEGRPWTIESNLATLPLHREEMKPLSEKAAFTAYGKRPEARFALRVEVAEKNLLRSPPPYLLPAELMTREDYQKEWPWLAGKPADLGLFLDISMVKRGLYDFNLDLAFAPGANETFKDFRSPTSVWIALDSHIKNEKGGK